jgi:hypothetical protein
LIGFDERIALLGVVPGGRDFVPRQGDDGRIKEFLHVLSNQTIILLVC